MVKLVDTPALGAGPRKRMRVRVSPAAPTQKIGKSRSFVLVFLQKLGAPPTGSRSARYPSGAFRGSEWEREGRGSPVVLPGAGQGLARRRSRGPELLEAPAEGAEHSVRLRDPDLDRRVGRGEHGADEAVDAALVVRLQAVVVRVTGELTDRRPELLRPRRRLAHLALLERLAREVPEVPGPHLLAVHLPPPVVGFGAVPGLGHERGDGPGVVFYFLGLHGGNTSLCAGGYRKANKIKQL